MKQQLEEMITFLASKITGEVTADDALKFSQAALNLANCQDTIKKSNNDIGKMAGDENKKNRFPPV